MNTKKRKASLLHCCEHHVVAADHEAGRIITGVPLREGQPLAPGSSVHFFDRKSQTLETTEIPREQPSGPAQVSTPAFRDGWEATFGRKKRRRKELMN